MLPDRGNAYTGTKASYVALSAVTVLALVSELQLLQLLCQLLSECVS